MKYEIGNREHQKIDNNFENITELIPKNSEIKLIKIIK